MQIVRAIIKPACHFYLLTTILFLMSCDKKGPKLLEVKKLSNYPSGSGLVYLDNHLYVIGDDATGIFKTDAQFNPVDSIGLFISGQERIPKDIKADLESIALVKLNKAPVLLLIGSGSLEPYRNFCWLVNPVTKEKKQIALDTFYNRIKNEGIRDLNIEGVAAVPSGIVLSCRGNKSFAKNHLIFTSHRFWEKQESAAIKIVKAGTNTDTALFAGISGLDYSFATDQLFLTVSTENTFSSYDDGNIGKSYLWIINDISSKKKLDAINPDRIIDLEEVDARFKGFKVESVCIVAENKGQKEIVLVSDDDKGGTVLFRLVFNSLF